MRQNVIWGLIIAFLVALAAIGVGYFKMTKDGDTKVATKTNQPAKVVASDGDGKPAGSSAKSSKETATGPTAEGGDASDGSIAANAGASEKNAADSLSFDVVGVEPTGEGVIAGRSDAGAIVALRANGEVVGKGIANSAGEWTIILDKPLTPGDYDVALEMQGENGEIVGESSQRLAVSIPEGGKSQPLIVLNAPDTPSSILQKPEETVIAAVEETVSEALESAGEAAESTAAAVADAAGEVAKEVSGAASQALEAGQAEVAEAAGTVAEVAKDLVAAVDGSSVDGAKDKAASGSETQTAGQAAVSGDGDENAGAVTAGPDKAPASKPVVVATASGGDKPSEQQASQVAENTDVAGDANSGGAPKVTVEAVESEQGKVFVAGTGEPGSSVRVYVDDKFAGEAEVSGSGRWLLEGKETISEGNVEVRADLVDQGADKVEARAAVTFEKEQPQQIVLTKVVASGEVAQDGSSGANVTKALPNVIIRKGDNLWRISRRLYGSGFRYTTIYQANKGQIRNPDLIYPGQVFLTPENDLGWKDQPTEDGVAIQ